MDQLVVSWDSKLIGESPDWRDDLFAVNGATASTSDDWMGSMVAEHEDIDDNIR